MDTRGGLGVCSACAHNFLVAVADVSRLTYLIFHPETHAAVLDPVILLVTH